MKKTSKEKIFHIKNINSRRLKRKIIKTRKFNSKIKKIKKKIEIIAPEKFIINGSENDRECFQDFLFSIEEKLKSGKFVRLNFNNTKKLFPCGMLAFTGKIFFLTNKYPEKISSNYPKLEIVEQMFQSVGLIKKLGKNNRIKELSHSDVLRWHYFTGNNVDTTSMNYYFDEIRDNFGKSIQMNLTSCINEALSNVTSHAYDKEEENKTWWIFSSTNKADSTMLIAIYDYGESIPKTILNKPTAIDFLNSLTNASPKRIDKKIFSEVSKGKSSTKLYYRGKGIPEMIEFANSNKKTMLSIYSRHGSLRKKIDSANIEVSSLNRKIDGTLVLWGLKLQEK